MWLSYCLISLLSRLYSWFSLSSFLGGIFKSALDKRGDIILVVVLGLGACLLAELAHQVLEGLVLLGTNLLDNVRKHVLKLFGLWVSSDNQEVLTH